ncbi:MAG: radical SAM protein [Spirochaetaceae bacterium]|nr:MAG: radical SAM protein [Spirochaetaceae bacterium]
MPDLQHWLQSCELCPNFCRVNRLEGKKGRCRLGSGLVVSSANLHYGEEPVLVGRGGSGTIFFTCCNLKCVFCQNYDISQLDYGRPVDRDELVRIMINLQDRGAENINLVTPTHQGAQIFEAVKQARRQGLNLPIVYNCGGYENPKFLEELEGLVQIFMPDFKYGNNDAGEKYSGVKEYHTYCGKALLEMHRQVGDLQTDARGVATQGLLVRHLVLPNRIADSQRVIDFLVSAISPNTYLNIMDQYHPAFHAADYDGLRRRVFQQEVEEVVQYARARGMNRFIR